MDENAPKPAYYQRLTRDEIKARWHAAEHNADGAIRVLRESWRDDGAEGEAAHMVCDEVERLRTTLAAVQAERDEALGNRQRPSAHELLAKGGEWLGAARSWLQWHKRNGSDVTWGSGDVLEPAFTAREVEDLAATVAAAAMAPQPDEKTAGNRLKARWAAERERDEATKQLHDLLAHVGILHEGLSDSDAVDAAIAAWDRGSEVAAQLASDLSTALARAEKAEGELADRVRCLRSVDLVLDEVRAALGTQKGENVVTHAARTRSERDIAAATAAELRAEVERLRAVEAAAKVAADTLRPVMGVADMLHSAETIEALRALRTALNAAGER